jgi:hypothetical protein
MVGGLCKIAMHLDGPWKHNDVTFVSSCPQVYLHLLPNHNSNITPRVQVMATETDPEDSLAVLLMDIQSMLNESPLTSPEHTDVEDQADCDVGSADLEDGEISNDAVCRNYVLDSEFVICSSLLKGPSIQTQAKQIGKRQVCPGRYHT